MVNGYVAIRVGPRRYRYEHRVIMEKMIGRSLKRVEVVHHKNEDKVDNRPENLELFPNNVAHMRARHRASIAKMIKRPTRL